MSPAGSAGAAPATSTDRTGTVASYNRSKQQGTDWERELTRKLAEQLGPGWFVMPMRVGGRDDPGDILIKNHSANIEVVVQARNRGAMNIHVTLSVAMTAAAKVNANRLAAVAWKRLATKAGNTKRTQMGVPVVGISLATFTELLKRASAPLAQLPGPAQDQHGH
jgi:hypothetical protein